MTTILALFFALAQAPAAPVADMPLSQLIDGIDRTFSRMSDLSTDFVQVLQDSLNQRHQESGHLYLKRERMMRFEYKNPEEKIFVSDGKTLYAYIPADRQVMKEAVKESLDERIPVMFLLRRGNLSSEFDRIEKLARKPFLPGTVVLKLIPKRQIDLNEVIMEVDPANFMIRRVELSYIDGQRSEFIFSNIRTNVGLESSLFDFKVPPGVEVVEGPGR